MSVSFVVCGCVCGHVIVRVMVFSLSIFDDTFVVVVVLVCVGVRRSTFGGILPLVHVVVMWMPNICTVAWIGL